MRPSSMRSVQMKDEEVGRESFRTVLTCSLNEKHTPGPHTHTPLSTWRHTHFTTHSETPNLHTHLREQNTWQIKLYKREQK